MPRAWPKPLWCQTLTGAHTVVIGGFAEFFPVCGGGISLRGATSVAFGGPSHVPRQMRVYRGFSYLWRSRF